MASQHGNGCVSHAKRVVEQHIPMHYDSHWLMSPRQNCISYHQMGDAYFFFLGICAD